MSKDFRSYDELLLEKQRLEALLKVQKGILHQDVQEIKVQLQPLRDTASFLGKILTKDKSSLLMTIGSDVLISSVMRKVLSKTGWLSRLVLPFFVKNFSSHFIADHKEKWLHTLKKWLGAKNGKHKSKYANAQENEDEVF